MVEAFVHPTAIVDAGAILGQRCKVWHFTHICAGARVGDDCSFGQNVYVSNDVSIGRNVRIQNNVSVYDGVTLEDDVFCGPSMVFTNVYNPRASISRKHEYRKTTIRRGATLGANCTIICGVEIGEHAFVAAGAVVNKDAPAFALMAGVPATRRGWMCKCGVQLPKVTGVVRCQACSEKYSLTTASCTAATPAAAYRGER
jgi:UDP-2-acetamido-3-amino-2,3-dideoxy-glucuronate N-acetyltransferase